MGIIPIGMPPMLLPGADGGRGIDVGAVVAARRRGDPGKVVRANRRQCASAPPAPPPAPAPLPNRSLPDPRRLNGLPDAGLSNPLSGDPPPRPCPSWLAAWLACWPAWPSD
ncbi:hypothetical protein I553_10574 [Mycobacterium xenopi 4042]|uniref:Uncharacterized protein n=1 Tax=Mycobacterium xenopi 4042 TaxID=1299334 RepID=X7ZER6_MYCXE|nr:hypothetical protein I553_10574 [Mycobacterium xenopi 4042]